MRAAAGRVFELVRKEFLQIRRDPRLMRILFLSPLIQLVVFGYAVSTDIRHTATFVVDQAGTAESRALLDAFTASGYFRISARSERPRDAVGALDAGEATIALLVPPDYAERLARGTATIQVLIDGTNSNIATVARGYVERIVRSHALEHARGKVDLAIDLRDRAWYNPQLESRNYNVPAVVGMIIMLVSFLLTSLAVVRERELGTLEQLMVSPIRPLELVAGKAIPFALIAMIDLLFISAVAILWFEVPFRGGILLLVAASLLYVLSGLGLGLFISTISRTQQEAFMATFLTFMPMILLSGFVFPVRSMPLVFQWLTLLNPVRHYMEIVRGIFLKGVGLEALWSQHLALLAMGIVILAFAAGRFRKRTA